MKDDGGPAFGSAEIRFYVPLADGMEKYIPAQDGMSLRDYFAGMAMQGLATGFQWTPGRIVSCEDELACDAYGIADAMIKAREKD